MYYTIYPLLHPTPSMKYASLNHWLVLAPSRFTVSKVSDWNVSMKGCKMAANIMIGKYQNNSGLKTNKYSSRVYMSLRKGLYDLVFM